MKKNGRSITYPRRSAARGLLRLIGRMMLPLVFDFKFTGNSNFPDQGPLIVIGNHTAAMEAAFLTVYVPWQIELLAAADIPPEKFVQWLSDFYGAIPLHRGSFDRAALRKALAVLDQNGVVGLFPEGGIWEEGKRQAQSGVAWLSYRSQAPILPIGYSNTTGMLNEALELKRPHMEMNVGEVIPPAELPEEVPRREYLRAYASRVMEEVYKLVPEEDRIPEPMIVDERFDLEVAVRDQRERPVLIPEDKQIQHASALAKVLHRPAILKIFRVNLNLPVEPLQSLVETPPAVSLANALQPILTYLEEENPFLLTYRFGPSEGYAMQAGLEELLILVNWVKKQEFTVQITPVRKYFSKEEGRKIVQRKQGEFRHWM